MLIPVWLIVTVVIAVFLLALVTVIAVAAWFGIATELAELKARVKVMQIDVFDVKTPLRRLSPVERA